MDGLIEKYDLFIFDLDDTLVKTEKYHYEAWLKTLKEIVGKDFYIDYNFFCSKFHSMIENSFPTKAEVCDISNAVLDGCAAVMLSGETANGDYPINAVQIMARICVEAEKVFNYKRAFNDMKSFTPQPYSTTEAVASAVCSAV